MRRQAKRRSGGRTPDSPPDPPPDRASAPEDHVSDLAAECGLASTGARQRARSGRWALRFCGSEHALVHCVVRGQAVIDGVGEPATLSQGQLAVLPHAVPHVVERDASDRDAAVDEAEAHDGEIDSDAVDDTIETVLLTLPFVLPSREGLVDVEIQPILRVLDVPHPEIVEMVLLASKLVLLPGPGDRYVVRRLAEAVLTKAVVQLAGPEQDRWGLFGFLAGHGVKAALRAVTLDPARAWSIGELAEIGGMPRKAFIASVRDLVGTDVATFVEATRAARARSLLRRGIGSLAEVADAVGFRSVSALSRALRLSRRGASTT